MLRENVNSEEFFIRCDPPDTYCTAPAGGSTGSLETLPSDSGRPVTEDMKYWERLEVLGDDSYDYQEEVGGQPGSFDYDDPRDYEEWCDWNDADVKRDIITQID